MATTKTKAETETKTENQPTYEKEQLIKSKKYADKRDFLTAVLSDEKSYTIAEVEEIISKIFYGGEA